MASLETPASRWTGPLLVVLALGLSAAFLYLDPAGPRMETWTRLGRGLLAVLVGGLGALGGGAALLERLAPELLEDARAAPHAMVAGLLSWMGLGGLLAWAGLLSPLALAAVPAVLATGWLLRPRLALAPISAAGGLILLALLAVGLIDALAPPVDADELYQHLALPARVLTGGELLGGPLAPDGSRPQGLVLIYASLMALGGEAGPRLFHLLLGLLLVQGLAETGRAWLGPRGPLAALLLLGSYSALHGLGLAASDLPVALACLAALDAALRGRAVALGLAAALALNLKYTAAGALAGAFLVAALPLRARVVAGAFALACLLPWWARNLAQGLHPLFPFAGWSLEPQAPGAPGAVGLPFQYLEKYGLGRAPRDFLLLPWNAVMRAKTDSFQFLGRLSPAFLVLLPTALLGLRAPVNRRLGLAALLGFAAWALGPHWLRYLLPALPAIALFLVAGLPDGRLPRLALALALALGLPANLGPLLRRAGDRLPAALGHEARATFQARLHPPAALYATLDRRLPEDAVLAILFDWSIYLSPRPVLLGSVEDHVPARAWLLTHGPSALADLKAAGATHLVVGRVVFLEKLYPFLSAEERARDLEGPQRLLEELLLREATLLGEEKGTRLYRLD